MVEGLGINQRGNAILCRSWGETDRADVCIAKTLEHVKGFMITSWLGDSESPELTAALERLAQHDWDNEHSIDWEFEIGQLTLEDVCA